MRCDLRLFVEAVVVGVANERSVVGVKEDLFGNSSVSVRVAKPEVAQETVRVCARKPLTVRRPLAVENTAVTLTLDLKN